MEIVMVILMVSEMVLEMEMETTFALFQLVWMQTIVVVYLYKRKFGFAVCTISQF